MKQEYRKIEYTIITICVRVLYWFVRHLRSEEI